MFESWCSVASTVQFLRRVPPISGWPERLWLLLCTRPLLAPKLCLMASRDLLYAIRRIRELDIVLAMQLRGMLLAGSLGSVGERRPHHSVKSIPRELDAL